MTDIVEALKARLRVYAEQERDDPQRNSVFALAQSLFNALEHEELDIAELNEITNRIHVDLLGKRIDTFATQHRIGAKEGPWATVEARLGALADKGWDAFRQQIETPTGGIVFTAHPTFALSRPLRRAMAEATVTGDQSPLGPLIDQEDADFERALDLPSEHDDAQRAIAAAQIALSLYAHRVFEVAQSAFPDKWRDLRPALPTLASWVGYDLDGRTDIEWYHSIAFRLSEKAEQLNRYAARIEALDTDQLGELTGRLRRVAQLSADQADLFRQDLCLEGNLAAAANSLTAQTDDRLVDANEIAAPLLEMAKAKSTGDALAADLLTLVAEIDAHQLGTARIHLRLNSAQIRTLIARDLGLETDVADFGRQALNTLARKAADPEVRPVSFADLFLERTTARKQFMLCAQIAKHIDAGSPIRFLIAESENPATVMGALFLASQYGIAEQLDISPLFETPRAMEAGGRFVERLLEQTAFREYLKTRGYLSLQFGFSDSGRFVGQIAGNMAIERIHSLVGKALSKAAPGTGLLLFNTHGESIGRGAYPGDFEARFDHLLTPWNRARFKDAGIPCQHEVSFQGGDGFLHFANPELAEASVAAFCEHVLDPLETDTEDAFYAERDFVWDFYRSLGAWQQRVFNDPDYGHFLSDFATSFLIKSGSRQSRRAGAEAGPRGLRAIPHNAVLQQLAMPLNSACGVGSSVRAEVDRLVDVINGSKRMSALIDLAVKTRSLSSAPALRGYASVTDPTVWVNLARRADDERARAYRRVSYGFRTQTTRTAMTRIANILSVDLTKFDRILAQLSRGPDAAERHETRLPLHLLHAIRQAAMMRVLALVGGLPVISRRHDVTYDDLTAMARQMQLGELIEALCRIFPLTSVEDDLVQNIDEPGFTRPEDELAGYKDLHDRVIGPLRDIQNLMHRITIATAHAYGAYG